MEDHVNTSHPAEAPLESWKEIAAHLKRDVRTVKRWEKSQGLPVHRHLHQSRSTVYAYASELDRWWATRRPAEEASGVLPGVLQRWPARALAFAAMLAMTVLTAGSGLVTSMSTAAQKPEVVLKRAWSDNRTDATGAPSPDGRYVSYVHWMTANLAVRDMATGETRDLTTEGTWNEPDQFAYYSIWDPDGRSIAYTWFNKDVHELRIVGLDGGQPRVLVRNKELSWIQPMSWSSDGQFILAQFRTLERVNQIVLVSVADGTSRVVKSLDWRWPQRMSLSPDGRFIVYDFPPTEKARQRDIYLLSADGSGERVLIDHPADDYAPVWTPDGQGVIFLSNRAGSVGAWMADVSAERVAGEARLVKPDMGRLTPLGFTTDGTLYYGVASYENGGDVMVAGLDLSTGGVSQTPRRAIQTFEGHNHIGRLVARLENGSPSFRGAVTCPGAPARGFVVIPLDGNRRGARVGSAHRECQQPAARPAARGRPMANACW
jgi:Periplasmic component of the Tol biopolymer transport system